MRHSKGFALAAIMAAIGAGCSGRGPSSECLAEPVGEFRVFVESRTSPPPIASLGFNAEVVAHVPEDDIGFRRVVLRKEDDSESGLAYRMPGAVLPVRVGTKYGFRVEYVAGFPGASGLVIRDASGLLFAAASDQGPGERVLRQGVPGFELEVLPSDCRSRPHGRCYDSIRNTRLRVTHDGQSATLRHGGSASLGRYRVDALTAQEVVYRPGCADAGLVALSWSIVRSGPD
jgi:hypothetical protein